MDNISLVKLQKFGEFIFYITLMQSRLPKLPTGIQIFANVRLDMSGIATNEGMKI